LNNVAAACIEIGQYDKGISSLSKALRLSEMHIPDQLFDRSLACTCFNCSLDGCITHTENDSSVELFDHQNNKSNDDNASKNIMHVDRHSTIYRRPIRVPPKSIQEKHNMGSTLFLILTFNLAMAHHLKVVSIINNKNASPSPSPSCDTTTKLIYRTLQLYELANDWQHRYKTYYNTSCCGEEEDEVEDDDDSIMTIEEAEGTSTTKTTSSNSNPFINVRFNMILYNNLSHLHRLMNNDNMSRRCLEHLLSTVMLVFDQNNTYYNNDSSSNRNTMNNNGTAVNSSSSNDIEFEYCDDDEEDEYLQQSTTFIDVQGFVQNISSLILKDLCADAA